MVSRALIGVACLCVAVSTAAAADDSSPNQWAKEHLAELVSLYKHFHQTPELSFAEKQTSARFAAELKAAGPR